MLEAQQLAHRVRLIHYIKFLQIRPHDLFKLISQADLVLLVLSLLLKIVFPLGAISILRTSNGLEVHEIVVEVVDAGGVNARDVVLAAAGAYVLVPFPGAAWSFPLLIPLGLTLVNPVPPLNNLLILIIFDFLKFLLLILALVILDLLQELGLRGGVSIICSF